MKFGTKAVHAGVEPDPSTGAIMTPVYQTSTYVQESPAKHKGYAYARGANPTRNALQKKYRRTGELACHRASAQVAQHGPKVWKAEISAMYREYRQVLWP